MKDNKLLIQILHVSQQLWSVVWISGYTALPEVLDLVDRSLFLAALLICVAFYCKGFCKGPTQLLSVNIGTKKKLDANANYIMSVHDQLL